MSKKICINPVFTALRGNFTGMDDDGHKATFRFRELSNGTRSFGLGKPKRNLQLHPYSSDEQQKFSNFAKAVALRQVVLADLMLRADWATRMKNDTTTKCTYLPGYLQQQAMKGHIADDGSYKD